MSLISYTKIADGETIDAADVNSPLDTIFNDYNGNIDSNNLASNAVTTAKITDANITAAKFAVGAITGADGWVSTSDTWTYASASTFTVAGDKTAVYTPGTRLKFTQTTVKYAVVVSSAYTSSTTVTIAVNTDYTIANAAITDNYYSYAANPQGYPGYFNFTPLWTNLTPGSGTNTGIFSVVGKTVTFKTYFRFGSGSSVGAAKLTLPVTINSAYTAGTPSLIGLCSLFDSGVDAYNGQIGRDGSIYKLNVSGSNIAAATALSSTVPFTWTTNDEIYTSATYIME